MIAKEQNGKEEAAPADFLIEALAASMTAVTSSDTRRSMEKSGVARSRKDAPKGGILFNPAIRDSERVRDLVRVAIRKTEKTHPGMQVVMLDKETLGLARQIQEHLPEIRDAKSDERIITLLKALVEFHDPLAEPRQRIDKANAALRIRFMENFDTFTSAEIAELANRTEVANVHNLASRWKSAKKIFAVDWQGQQRFPAFQFDHGKPRKVIREVLGVLDGSLGPWETAFWFVSSNKWLDGKAPVSLLDDENAVVRAAYSTVGEHFG